MIKKKKISLLVRNIFEQAFKGRMDRFYIEDVTEITFVVYDADPHSDFYFNYAGSVIEDNTLKHEFNYCPIPTDSDKVIELTLNSEGLKNQLASWINTVERYSAKSELFDRDEVVETYVNEQQPYFEILDEDSEVVPFDRPRQIAIYNAYEEIIKEISASLDFEEVTEEEAQKLVKEVKDAQKSLGSETKKQAIGTLSRTYAKIRKISPALAEKISIGVLAKLVIDGLPKLVEWAKLYLNSPL